jgi:signal transduction histidine kinase
VSHKHKTISFKVEDTGNGIKDSDAEQIFKLYGQINDKLSRRETGIGFRLALCKDIVSILKGTLSAKRNEGIPGSTFSIILPSASDATDSSVAGDNSVIL